MPPGPSQSSESLPPPTVSVVVPAAGSSTRLAGPTRKPFRELAGRPILLRTCERLRSMPGVGEIILAVHPDDLADVQGKLWEVLRAAGVHLVVAGGEVRAQSVWNALAVADPEAELVAVHDAVRPFISPAICAELFRVARDRGAAVPVVPVNDTIKRTEADKVTETVRRRGLMRVQTPQVFRRELFVAANEYARATGGFCETITDDASLVESYGKEVAVVLGEEYNLKITTPRDLRMAEALLAAGVVE